MGIDCTGMGGSGNVKRHSRASLLHTSTRDVNDHVHLCLLLFVLSSVFSVVRYALQWSGLSTVNSWWY